jgi:hypothetical protein
MTLREIAEALKKEFPNEYSNFTIEVNVHPRTAIKPFIPDSDTVTEIEVSIYSEKTKHIYGSSFEDCLGKILAKKKRVAIDMDKEVPTMEVQKIKSIKPLEEREKDWEREPEV